MENERRTAVPSTPRLAPEDIATRAFSSSFRGVSESEVRSFLKRVAEEMTAAQVRERELRESLSAAEVRAEHREPLDESELLEALGEETAKLLRSAREAAKDIRSKAEESAARVRSEANEEADRVRSEAAGLLETRRDEADREIAELRARIDAELAEQRSAADTEIALRHDDSVAAAESLRAVAAEDAERVVSEAKATGRSMVEEAKSLRDRILADLAHRRGLLQAQIAELKHGREQLLDAYRTVKRTFLEATEALSLAEARFAQDRPTPVAEAEVAAAFDAAVVEATADELGADLTDDHLVTIVEGTDDETNSTADTPDGAAEDSDETATPMRPRTGPRTTSLQSVTCSHGSGPRPSTWNPNLNRDPSTPASRNRRRPRNPEVLPHRTRKSRPTSQRSSRGARPTNWSPNPTTLRCWPRWWLAW